MRNSVRDVRLKQEINQVEMAKLCGVSRQTIHAVEQGTFNPSLLLGLKIAKVLNTRVDQLFVLEEKD